MIVLRKPAIKISDINKGRLKMFVNKGLLSNTSPDEVCTNHQKIYDFIMTYTNPETQKSYLQTLIDSLKRVDKISPELEEIIRDYATNAYNLSKKNDESYKTNEVKEKRSELMAFTYEKLCEIMNELTIKFDLHSLDPSNASPFTMSEHMILVALNMNLRQAPLRSEISDMMFVDLGVKDTADKYDFKDDLNYLIRDVDGSYRYHLYKYKTKGIYGDRSIYIKSEALTKFLDKSFKLLPRKYLIGSVDPDKPYRYAKYLKLLKKYFGSGFGCDHLRSIYISEFMRYNPTIKARELLADSMLHNIVSQSLYYDKRPKGHIDRLPTPSQDVKCSAE
jgi:hypothetical protein